MLHVEVLSALVFDHESWDRDSGTVDPVIVARGELPGRARPFVVDRIYRGPQGYYDESFVLLGPDGSEVYHHPYARLTLRGEMFEDRYRDVVRDRVTVSSADEHRLLLLVNDREVGRIPVFVDAPESATAAGVLGDALDATLKKSAIIWLDIPQPDGGRLRRPAWFVYQAGKVYLLTGPDEQELTNIDSAAEVTLIARSKEDRSRIATVPASVRVVERDSDEWERIAHLGLGTRLNLPDGDAALDRWRTTCTMVELTPQVTQVAKR